MTDSDTAIPARLRRVRDRLAGGPASGTRLVVAIHVAILAALAYLPALTAAPGRMPTDTKLYLYFDPSRLTGDAPFAWDSRQFAGWVPHQTVSYLWPSGPWYSFFDWIGAPDWVAHRLWIATVLVLGGLGARWAARHLGLSLSGALIAAMCYQLSPYILPYLSRTSAMLLPWAGLGWLIALTIRAATQTRWRHVAIFGLVMATVAAPNATAILMIAPAPVLWLLHAAFSRIITWKRAGITAAKIGGISAAVSLWWIAMLSVQGRFGADVLGYSESLEAVSFTSSSPEVLRGMGYWLFYVRDPIGFTTSAAFDYMSSGRLVAVGFALLLVGLAGLAWTKWSSRRYAILLVAVGVVLAVGVHPIDDPSPLLSPFAENSRSSIALALRSSTRALPLSTLGFALGSGALVTAIRGLRDRLAPRARNLFVRTRAATVAALLVGLLAVANLPALFDGGFVDPILERDQDPPAGLSEAAATLDAGSTSYRVLQLPGSEFGAFRWGYTVDPPLPGLTEKPLVTRDLLPLGSPAAMDLVYALDDRFQEGWAENTAVAPIARLLGVDTIWLPDDVAFDRFRTPRPELTSAQFAAPGDGLGTPVPYGPPAPNVPVIAVVDEQSISEPAIGTPLPNVELVPVEDPEAIVRVKTDPTVVAGSADGLVDAAAAGLLSGHELIRYTADLLDASATNGDAARIDTAAHVIVTDSNRDRAHQWRTAQDVWGFTEDGGDGAGVLRFDSADQRTPVFADPTSADMTIAEQRGPVMAAVSSYGEPFAYRPENRAAMAVDGDPATAWVVGDRFEAIGEYIRLTADEPLSTLRLVQPQDARNRWITEVSLSAGGQTERVALTDESRSAAGQTVTLPAAAGDVTVTITATASNAAPAAGLDAVGFAEVDAGRGPTDEVVRVPSNVLPATTGAQQVDIVLTRLRTRATNRWRGDPEPKLTRAFTLAGERAFDATVTTRLDPRASDATIAALIGWTGTTADRRLAGVPAMGGWAATDGSADTSWVTPFGQAVGSTLTIPLATERPVTTLALHQPPSAQFSVITEIAVTASGATRTVAVPAPDASGASVVTFDAISGPQLQLTITATNDATTVDRRYANTVTLPAALSEVTADNITPAALPTTLDVACRDDVLTLDDTPVAVHVSGPLADLFAGSPATTELCGDTSWQLRPGEHIVRSAAGLATGIEVDRVVLRAAPVSAPAAATSSTDTTAPSVAATVTATSHTHRTIRVDACPDGCWLVFGEGFNAGWSATSGGHSLGAPTQVDGGFNGWYLPPSADARTVFLKFEGQRTLTIGLVLSGVAVLACIAIVLADRRRRDDHVPDAPLLTAPWAGAHTSVWSWRSPAALTTATALAAGTLVISPLWGLICAAIAFACGFLLHRPRLVATVSIGLAAYIGASMALTVVREHPFANAGFPAEFEDLHHAGMAVVVLLLASAFAGRRATSR
jgi:arabinofuranan 3-O-arabinosyltransferase